MRTVQDLPQQIVLVQRIWIRIALLSADKVKIRRL